MSQRTNNTTRTVATSLYDARAMHLSSLAQSGLPTDRPMPRKHLRHLQRVEHRRAMEALQVGRGVGPLPLLGAGMRRSLSWESSWQRAREARRTARLEETSAALDLLTERRAV